MFITLEGGDGVGKSTQAALLTDALRARGHDVLQTREPGGAPAAEQVRRLFLEGGPWTEDAEIFLMMAARAEHVERTLRPALAAGRWVVCDRFHDSTLAYQGGTDAARARIAALGAWLGLVPDRTLILSFPPGQDGTGLARARARPGGGDRVERLSGEHHARIDAAFRRIAAENPGRCRLIDASGTADMVQARLLAALND